MAITWSTAVDTQGRNDMVEGIDSQDAILSLRNLSVVFSARGGFFYRKAQETVALNSVSLDIGRSEIYGIVGESGSGKTTLARTILGLQSQTSGEIRLNGAPLSSQGKHRTRKARSSIQYVHQDAAASLDPWWSVGASLEEGLSIHGIKDRGARRTAVDEMLSAVGLDPQVGRRYLHELSGGQLRRIAIARILLLRPEIVLFDEPTAGLDMSVQSVVLKLILDLKKKFSLTYIFISHDLSIVRSICTRIAIMHRGEVVEEGEPAAIYADPQHPYTRKLLGSALHLPPKEEMARLLRRESCEVSAVSPDWQEALEKTI